MNQKKVKFNIVDIIVILVLLAGAVFLAVRMFGGQEAVPAPVAGKPYQVTFYAECVPEQVAASLQPNTQAVGTSVNMDLGKLVDFSVGESVCYTTDSKGKIVQTTKPGHVSVTLVCQMDGTNHGTGLQVGQYTLRVGSTMAVCCGLTEIEAMVLDITPAP